MRRILVENARRKQADKHGGGRLRVELPVNRFGPETRADDLVALDESLSRLEEYQPPRPHNPYISFAHPNRHSDESQAFTDSFRRFRPRTIGR
jgi:hypothetical protein